MDPFDSSQTKDTDMSACLESNNWDAPTDTPFCMPRTPFLDGVSLRRRWNDSLSTPKGKQKCCDTQRFNQLAPGVTDGPSDQNLDIDTQDLHVLLAEQTEELNRVMAIFAENVIALYRTKLATKKHAQVPERVPATSEEAAACGAQMPEVPAFSTEQPSSHGSENRAHQIQQPYKPTFNSKSSLSSITPQKQDPLSVDFKMVRGWMDGMNHKKPRIAIMTHVQSRKPQVTGMRVFFEKLVGTTAFDAFSTMVILTHSVLMGVNADQCARHGETTPEIYERLDIVFLAWYGIELLLRICKDSFWFFLSGWNVFDFSLVSCDTIAHVMVATAGGASDAISNVTTARTFRVLRLLRAFRVLRLVRFFREFRMMMKCVFAGVKTAIWVVLLLFMVIYIFALYLVEQVSRGELTKLESESRSTLTHRFGTLTDGWLSLFMAIAGGVSWVELADPLIQVHWTNGLVICVYIFFTIFVMLNIVTGVFVDCALNAANSDEEEIIHNILQDEGSNLNKIRNIFEQTNLDGDDGLTFEELEAQLGNEEIRLLFKSIGIGIHEVHGLFRLLDMDNSGSVNLEEFVTGCMRLRESASGVDLATIMYENKRMMEKWQKFAHETKRQFAAMHDHIDNIYIKN